MKARYKIHLTCRCRLDSYAAPSFPGCGRVDAAPTRAAVDNVEEVDVEPATVSLPVDSNAAPPFPGCGALVLPPLAPSGGEAASTHPYPPAALPAAPHRTHIARPRFLRGDATQSPSDRAPLLCGRPSRSIRFQPAKRQR